MHGRVIKYSLYVPFLAVSFLLFSAFAIKLATLYIILFFLTLLYFFSNTKKIILLLSTLILIVVVTNFLFHCFGITSNIYYRPSDELQFRGKFRPNTTLTRQEPYGDLNPLSLGELAQRNLIIPRKTIFKTDSLGFRNSADYLGQKHLLIGDSFIVGVGSSQEDILSEQLLRKDGIDTYNLASIWNLSNYAEELKRFQLRFGTSSKAFVFLFEGNDFPIENENRKIRPLTRWEENRRSLSDTLYRWNTLFSFTPFYRYLYSLYYKSYAQVTESLELKKKDVSVFKVHSIPMAFYNHYAYDVSERESYNGTQEFEKNLSDIAPFIQCLFFIPTKYRVYSDWIDPKQNQVSFSTYTGRNLERKNIPHAQWIYLKKLSQKLNICAVDLTDKLKKESARLLSSEQTTWWPDDTHWNKYGIAVAALEVRKTCLNPLFNLRLRP
ncbi:MAG: hypothetical protein HYS98_06135 [Deltaproteobacteria bacterium]|nr:hypothetical protein [Deltaproteobacteria bacterium]